MSQKNAKKERKELKERETGFMAALDAASKEFRIGLQPVIQYRPDGAFAAMRLIDEEGAYGNVTPEAEKQNEAEREQKSQEVVDPQVET